MKEQINEKEIKSPNRHRDLKQAQHEKAVSKLIDLIIENPKDMRVYLDTFYGTLWFNGDCIKYRVIDMYPFHFNDQGNLDVLAISVRKFILFFNWDDTEKMFVLDVKTTRIFNQNLIRLGIKDESSN